ncbi:MAG: hypothetical protein JHC95_16615 [Solirubrobacteraceae bacterium]|nr:hypothetical protein [Solirubrobacteraceae bacterium]
MSTETTPQLFGRAREVTRVAHAVTVGRPVLIIGEPGIGKTALARAGGRAANPANIWQGGGIATLDWVSYLPFRRALQTEIPNAEPSVVADFLADRADGGVFIIDDLQWVDDDTITATLLLAEQAPVIATTRPVPRGEDVRERLAAARFDVIDLAPLPEPDAAELALAQNPSLTRLDAISVARRARGNPLLIQGLAHAERDTTELSLALRARLADLTPDAREILHRIAILERPAQLDIASDDLQQLLDMGLVIELPDGVQVRHALIADAVLEGLSAEEQREVHRALAPLLDAPGEAARHWAAAGERGAARGLALRAAQTADRPVERARCAALAATCLEGPERDGQIVAAMARLAALGDFGSVVGLREEIAPGSDVEPEAYRLQARGLFESDDAEAAGEAIASGLTAAQKLEDAAATARLKITAAYHGLWSMEFDADAILEAIACAEEVGAIADAEMHVQAAAGLAPALVGTDNPLAVEMAHRGRELARAEGHDWAEQESWAAEATALTNLDRAAEARECTRRGEAELLAKGYHATVARIRASRADLLIFDCEFDTVLALTEELLARPSLLGGSWDTATWSRAFALSETGHAAAADALFSELGSQAQRDRTFNVTWLRAKALLSRGDGWSALPLAEAAVEYSQGTFLQPQAAATLRRAQWECGIAVTPPGPLMETRIAAAFRAELAGLGALDAGDCGEAIEHFRLAISQNGWRRHRLRCRLGLAEALDQVDPEQATAEFEALATDLREAGWAVLHRRVEPLVTAPPGSRRLRAASPRGAGDLTERENTVLTLVADGLTSRQIADRLGISQPTVETHVQAAMRKLGAKTRAEAAATAKTPTATR